MPELTAAERRQYKANWDRRRKELAESRRPLCILPTTPPEDPRERAEWTRLLRAANTDWESTLDD